METGTQMLRTYRLRVSFLGEGEEEMVRLSSAEEGEVALPAAHLAAHGGQHVVDVPSGELRARAASAAAQSLRAVLLPCGQNWTNKHTDIKRLTGFSPVILFARIKVASGDQGAVV